MNRWLGSAWQITVGGIQVGLDRRAWVNRCYHYCSDLFQPKISRFWSWVVNSYGCVNLLAWVVCGCLVVSILISWVASVVVYGLVGI